MKLRIHHFFDIVRDFGIGRKFDPHPYQHSYHEVALMIWQNPEIELELVTGFDAVCKNCIQLTENSCKDIITHRKDYTSKEAFNNYLDARIFDVCEINTSIRYSPGMLVKLANRYVQNIEYIYEGNDPEHTAKRKRNVIRGLETYSIKHNIL